MEEKEEKTVDGKLPLSKRNFLCKKKKLSKFTPAAQQKSSLARDAWKTNTDLFWL